MNINFGAKLLNHNDIHKFSTMKTNGFNQIIRKINILSVILMSQMLAEQ